MREDISNRLRMPHTGATGGETPVTSRAMALGGDRSLFHQRLSEDQRSDQFSQRQERNDPVAQHLGRCRSAACPESCRGARTPRLTDGPSCSARSCNSPRVIENQYAALRIESRQVRVGGIQDGAMSQAGICVYCTSRDLMRGPGSQPAENLTLLPPRRLPNCACIQTVPAWFPVGGNSIHVPVVPLTWSLA